MKYKNTLKDYLKFAETSEEQGFLIGKLDTQGRYYHLSHSLNFKNDPQEMNLKEIKEYIEDNYVNSEYINKYELINDLNIFKSLREELKIKCESDKFYTDTLSLMITVFSIFSAVAVGFLSVDEKIVEIKNRNTEAFYTANINFVFNSIKIILIMAAIYFVFYYLRVYKRSGINRLKTINHVVFTLETIKENLEEVPEMLDSDVEADNVESYLSETKEFTITITVRPKEKSKNKKKIKKVKKRN